MLSLQEKTIVEEKLIKMGERDITLPPEFRPTEEDRKVADVHVSVTHSVITTCVMYVPVQ